jgi:hypothetical protein
MFRTIPMSAWRYMPLSGFAVFIICIATCLGKTETGADQFLVAQQKEAAKNPSGLIYTIRLKDNKNSFQQGEIIPIEFGFSSKLPNKYQLDNRLYDRGGRLGIDSYQIDPSDGAVDPLENSKPGMDGGLSSPPILNEKPYLIVRELNEYLRFDKPGKYRLYVISDRIESDPVDQQESKQQKIRSQATSNIIEFIILPRNKEWADQRLQMAKRILVSSDRLKPIQLDEKIASAVRMIRFLGTEEAVRYMVRHFSEFESDFGDGLIGSPFRSTVIKEMEVGLNAPDCAVTGRYLWILTLCSYAHQYPNSIPAYPGEPENEKIRLWQDAMSKALPIRNSIREEYIKRLAHSIATKKGSAKAVSTITLLSETSRRRDNMPSWLSEKFAKKLPSELRKIFFDLPARTQGYLIAYQWALIKSPEMTPILERFIETPSRENDMFITNPAGIALQRIFEINPKRGRELILREIVNPNHSVQFETLAILPDKTLPEVDNALATALEKALYDRFDRLTLEAQLLARYGTSAILPRIKAAALGKKLLSQCGTAAPIIAYFLRVDPATGAAELEKALSSNTKYSCRTNLLGLIADMHFGAELESIAIRRLDDSDLNTVMNAAEILGKYGSAQAEASILKRFEKWHDEWKEKSEELQFRKIGQSSELDMPRMMEDRFRIALATGRGWLADVEKLRKIQSLCLTENEREQVKYNIRDADEKRIYFSPRMEDTWEIQVAQYHELNNLDAVKSKLAQYPKGAIFLWCTYNEGQAEERKNAIFGELKSFLEKLGMRLEKQKIIPTPA